MLISPAQSSFTFEILYRAFMFFCRFPRVEGAKASPSYVFDRSRCQTIFEHTRMWPYIASEMPTKHRSGQKILYSDPAADTQRTKR